MGPGKCGKLMAEEKVVPGFGGGAEGGKMGEALCLLTFSGTETGREKGGRNVGGGNP